MRKSLIATAVVATLITGVTSASAVTIPTRPTLAQKAQLQYLVEEEKLARDVYNYFAANVTSQKFSNIARSEQTHMDNIAALLKSYNFYNPTTNRAPGVFRNTELQKLYNSLIEEGSASVAAAFGVGVKIEEMDISDLKKMETSAAPAAMQSAIALLIKGSQNHLAAFTR
jgi:hypothetical protein